MNVAFAGFAHPHAYDGYDLISKDVTHNIVGVWENDPKVIKQLEKQNIKVTYESYDVMLKESGADIVSVGSCFSERGEMIIKALRAGKHVFVDKPVCTKMSELMQIERLAKEKNLKIGCMLTLRFLGKIAAIRDFIMKGGIGEIKTIYYGMQHPLFYGMRDDWFFDEKKHGGVINDIAVHGIDLIRFISGLSIKKVLAARCWSSDMMKETGFKDNAQFMAMLSNDAGLLADISYSVPDALGYSLPNHWDIFGTKGVIRFSLQDIPTKVYYDAQKEPVILEDMQVTTDFWQDFINEIDGKKAEIISTEDVILSTRETLNVQEYANS